MDGDNTLFDLVSQVLDWSASNRPLRLRLAHADGLRDDLLLPLALSGGASVCGGIEYRIWCVAASATLALKQFIALPAELQIVTDRGQLHRICGIVAEAGAGCSDGGLATYQLVLRDAMALMEQRINTRIFRDMNELDVISQVLSEWRLGNAILARSFNVDIDSRLAMRQFPPSPSIMQAGESDAAFVRRLLKRRGIAWFFRAGQADASAQSAATPSHTLVLFDTPAALQANAAGTVRFHRDGATEERDAIMAWRALRGLRAGSVTHRGWDIASNRGNSIFTSQARGAADQGPSGNLFAASLDDYLVDLPHGMHDYDTHGRVGQLRMAYHDYASKCFEGESGVRDLNVGEWIGVSGHAELDKHPAGEREFVVTSLRVEAENNLPKALDVQVRRQFARNGWGSAHMLLARDEGTASGAGMLRYRNSFTCVRRGIAIVPDYDPRVDMPNPPIQTVIVVGPPDEAIHCDQYGRVKVRFPATRPADHKDGVGTSNTDIDSFWVRVASNWAGDGPGSHDQFGLLLLPRPGTEALMAFVGGDPDKGVIIGQLFSPVAAPPALSQAGELPGNRYLSGMRSREVRGTRANQLCLDDFPGQISAQLASDHGRSELNLGWMVKPRHAGEIGQRGEGAELRSDEHIALRAGKGMLLSAWKRLDGADKQLERAECLSLMADCLEMFRSLGKQAAQSLAAGPDEQPQAALLDHVRQWENGSNTAPLGEGGGAPLIGLSAPDGLCFSTSKAIVSYAATNIDMVACQHLQLTSGQRYSVNAGQGVSMFAASGGIKAIAGQGKVLVQSQQDDIELNSARQLKLTATEGLLIAMAKEIHLIAEDGSFIKIGGGVTFGSNSPLKFCAPDFVFDAPVTMATQFPSFNQARTDLKFVAKYYPHMDGGVVAPALGVKIDSSDGKRADGKSDAAGNSELLRSEAMHLAGIVVTGKGTPG